MNDGISGGPWWWANSRGSSALFHATDNGEVEEYEFDHAWAKPPTTVDYALVANAEYVALAVGDRLIALDRRSGLMTEQQLVLPSADPVAGALMGAEVPVTPRSVAIHDGVAAIAFDRGDAIIEVDLKTGKQYSILLPQGLEAGDLAYDGNGVLAAIGIDWNGVDLDKGRGAVSDQLLFFAAGKWRSVASEAFWLIESGNQIVAGGPHLDLVHQDGEAYSLSRISDDDFSDGQGMALAGDAVYVPAGNTVEVASLGGDVQSYILPDFDCTGRGPSMPRSSEQGSPAPNVPEDKSCPDSLSAFAVTARDSVWAVAASYSGLVRLHLEK